MADLKNTDTVNATNNSTVTNNEGDQTMATDKVTQDDLNSLRGAIEDANPDAKDKLINGIKTTATEFAEEAGTESFTDELLNKYDVDLNCFDHIRTALENKKSLKEMFLAIYAINFPMVREIVVAINTLDNNNKAELQTGKELITDSYIAWVLLYNKQGRFTVEEIVAKYNYFKVTVEQHHALMAETVSIARSILTPKFSREFEPKLIKAEFISKTIRDFTYQVTGVVASPGERIPEAVCESLGRFTLGVVKGIAKTVDNYKSYSENKKEIKDNEELIKQLMNKNVELKKTNIV
jgi:hypothetical protein